MILRSIELQLFPDEFSKANYASDFLFRSCYVGHFLTRRIRPQRLYIEKFNRIVVEGYTRAEEMCPIICENVACPPVTFNRVEYDSLAPGEQHEFFLGMLREGIDKCNRHHKIPYAEIVAAMDEFRRGGYKNEWIDKTKLFRPGGVRASLLCSLDTNRFLLTLQLEKQEKIIFREPILETLPDEIFFANEFKELVLEGDNLVVKTKFEKTTFSLDMRPFLHTS